MELKIGHGARSVVKTIVIENPVIKPCGDEILKVHQVKPRS